jgi:hypothetical protein
MLLILSSYFVFGPATHTLQLLSSYIKVPTVLSFSLSIKFQTHRQKLHSIKIINSQLPLSLGLYQIPPYLRTVRLIYPRHDFSKMRPSVIVLFAFALFEGGALARINGVCSFPAPYLMKLDTDKKVLFCYICDGTGGMYRQHSEMQD